MDLERIISNKPKLYHYTRDDSLMKILSSQSLLARPTWNFADTEEYVLGLRLIGAQLKYVYSKHSERDELSPSTRTLLDAHEVDSRILLEHAIQNIEYEIVNYDNPRVVVYVACFSENGLSEKMIHAYGGNIISFNFLLPAVAYAYPRPFHMSMLSRVSYDRREFSAYIMRMGFLIQESFGTEDISGFLNPLSKSDRIKALSTTVTEFLCSFAPNIKHARFSYEREWRLKTVVSSHLAPTLLNTSPPLLRQEFELPEEASFTDDVPKRYIQKLSFCGKMITDAIYGFGASGSLLKEQVAEWQRIHSMPHMDIQDFLRAFRSAP